MITALHATTPDIDDLTTIDDLATIDDLTIPERSSLEAAVARRRFSKWPFHRRLRDPCPRTRTVDTCRVEPTRRRGVHDGHRSIDLGHHPRRTQGQQHRDFPGGPVLVDWDTVQLAPRPAICG